MEGTPNDCRKCACPLEDDTNNFSPTCKSNDADGYLCTECPEGYTGDHCEMYVKCTIAFNCGIENLNVNISSQVCSELLRKSIINRIDL